MFASYYLFFSSLCSFSAGCIKRKVSLETACLWYHCRAWLDRTEPSTAGAIPSLQCSAEPVSGLPEVQLLQGMLSLVRMYISFHGVRVTCVQWWVFTCIALTGTKSCEPPLCCCHGKNSNNQAKLCINCVHFSGFKKLSQASGYD